MSVKLSTDIGWLWIAQFARKGQIAHSVCMGDIELLTPEAVCKALAISPTTLWRLSKSGQLVPFYVLSSPRYTRAQLEAYVYRQQKISREVWLSD